MMLATRFWDLAELVESLDGISVNPCNDMANDSVVEMWLTEPELNIGLLV